MTLPNRCPVVDFDHNSPEHSADPAASYRALRQEAPVAWSEANGGYWILSGYDAVFNAARDDATFTSRRMASGGDGLSVVIPKTPMHTHIPIELDPPEFRPYRQLVNLITAPAAVGRMTALIGHHTTRFIDEVIEGGHCDFADIIGVPSIITVDWLGLDIEDWKRYSFAHRMTLAATRDSAEFKHAVEVDLPYLSQKMRDAITDRRASPRDDVISFLVSQEVNGAPLSDEDTFSILELLIAGGTVTTSSLVGQALVWLYQHQDVRRRLIEDPSLLTRATEEFLRYFSPTQALARTVTHDVEFQGCPMRASDRVLLAWASANRDSAAGFSDPDTLDITRWPNRHTAFGIGVHRCAGSHLGRAMAHELLGQVLQRMPDYVIDLEGLQTFQHQGVNAGHSKIPATFTPGRRQLNVTS